MQKYAVIYRPGEAWKKGRPWQDQDLHEHGAFMEGLLKRGSLMCGGPFADHSGGLAIIRAENDAAIWSLIAQDPAVVTKLAKVEIHPWITVFDLTKRGLGKGVARSMNARALHPQPLPAKYQEIAEAFSLRPNQFRAFADENLIVALAGLALWMFGRQEVKGVSGRQQRLLRQGC